MDEWKVGDPIGFGNDLGVPDIPYMGYLHNDDEDEPPREPTNNVNIKSKADILGEEAWKLYMNNDDKRALELINQALSHNNQHSNNWNRKAIILEGLKRFDESKKCYDKSLSLNRKPLVVENKARMLKSWAAELYWENNNLPKAINLLNEAISEISSLPSSEEDINSYKRFVSDIQDKIDEIEKSQQSKNYKNLKDNLSADVIRALTKKGRSLESVVYNLSEFIKDFERKEKCVFNRVYYSDKSIRGNVGLSKNVSLSGILVEFNKIRPYLNSKMISDYYEDICPDHVLFDLEYIEIIDESYLFNKPEFSQLKQTMKNEGYDFDKLDFYTSGEIISITFVKDELLFKKFNISLKNNEIKSSTEFFNLFDCYYSYKNKSERNLLQQEINRIEKQFNCSLSSIESPAKIYFDKNVDNGKLKFRYNFKTKKIEEGEDLTLKYPNEELIVITQTSDDSIIFKKGMKFKLIKESRNKEDYNAIAVYLGNDKIGYILNDFGYPYGTSMAKEINISDNAYAEYLVQYNDFGQLHHVARIIENKDAENDESNPNPITNPKLRIKVERLHQIASIHLRKSEFDIAIVYLKELLAIEPSNISFLQTAGYCCHELKQYDESLQYFSKILELDSNNYNALFFKSKMLTELEKYEESMEYLNKLIKLKPNDSNNWFYKASNLVALGQYDEADTYFDKAIKLNPNLIHVWYQKALNLITLEQYEEAISCLDKVIELNPSLDTPWYTKGKTLIELNRYEESIEYLDKTIELNPKSLFAYNTKGMALTELGKYDDAIACFDEVLFLDPTNSVALHSMGYLCLVGLKDYKQAIKYIKVALKLDPDNSMNWNNLGDAYLNIGEYGKALECCDKARSLDLNNFRAWFTSAEVYYELNEYGHAMEYATKAKELNSTDEDLLNFIDKLEEILSAVPEVMVDPIRKPISQKEFNELKTRYNEVNYNYRNLISIIMECAENNQSAEEILKIAKEKKFI